MSDPREKIIDRRLRGPGSKKTGKGKWQFILSEDDTIMDNNRSLREMISDLADEDLTLRVRIPTQISPS